ncbi:hypothetical protein AXF42_Ash006752 [Apostasia shenzhenica]|uniref:Uncharacterized protein n=1 Tax=Apostasia shenzhenica TaxID=1088818 RepID=A0A2I0AJ34_9ASPA|nr:hypothetical protein AXF42_Ash006752 [Apostasia shenzhenica]
MISANPKTKICPERDQSINSIPSCDIVHDSIHRTFVANNGGSLAAECNDSRMLGSGVENNSFLADEKAALCDVRKSLEPASVLYSAPPTNSSDDSEADSGIKLLGFTDRLFVCKGSEYIIIEEREKVAVIFSFLLGNISARISVHYKDAKGDDSFVLLQSLALDISIDLSKLELEELTKNVLDLDVNDKEEEEQSFPTNNETMRS